jgi:hypothetical protein
MAISLSLAYSFFSLFDRQRLRLYYTVKKYSRPGRVWSVTSRLGTGKSVTFFYSVGSGGGMVDIIPTTVKTASLHWLNNVSGVYLVQVSLLVIGQRGLGHFFRYRPLLLIYANARGKQPIQYQPFLVQYKQQVNPLLSMHNRTPLVISRNYKYKQLTLLSQRKVAFTARNTLFAL